MNKRNFINVNNKSYPIEYFDESIIANNPYAAVWFVPPKIPHKSTFFKITYIEEGEADIDFFSRVGGKTKTAAAKAKDVFIITPNDIHNYHVNPRMKYSQKDIYVMKDVMKECCDVVSDELYDEIMQVEYPVFFNLSTTTISSLSEILTTIVFESESKTNTSIHKSIIIYILGQYVVNKEHFSHYPKWIKKLLRNLNNESYLVMSVEELVKSTGFSHTYVSSQFKRFIGISLKKYVNKSKLTFAQSMLVSSDCSMEDIVERLGFNTTSNFINLFKAEFGITPGKYRKDRQSQA